MSIAGPQSPELSTAAAAYPGAGETGRLRGGRLRFFRTIAESVGVQGPTAAAVLGGAIVAGISGGGTALVHLVAAVAMGFVAYAFIIFTRGFDSAGSVYGFTGAVAGPRFGFLSAWALMLTYASFAGAVYALTADEAQPAFGAIGLHLAWPVDAIITFVLVMALAYLDITISATVAPGLGGRLAAAGDHRLLHHHGQGRVPRARPQLGAVPARRGTDVRARPRDRLRVRVLRRV